jgi:ATP-dependent DNA helicase RecG
VIADIFSRMHFMERRGSGFKKIKADYRHAVSYRPELEPVFQSTPTSFFATLYNLNYNVAIKKVAIAPKNVAIDVAIDSLIASKATIEKVKTVYANFGTDGVFGRSTIAAITNDSVTAAGNLIKKLKEAGLIESVSGQGKGKYKFIEPNE